MVNWVKWSSPWKHEDWSLDTQNLQALAETGNPQNRLACCTSWIGKLWIQEEIWLQLESNQTRYPTSTLSFPHPRAHTDVCTITYTQTHSQNKTKPTQNGVHTPYIQITHTINRKRLPMLPTLLHNGWDNVSININFLKKRKHIIHPLLNVVKDHQFYMIIKLCSWILLKSSWR